MSIDTTNSGLPPLNKLGSLAQAAREKSLNQARGILIVIGVLTIGVNAFDMVRAPELVHDAFQKAAQAQIGPGMVIDQEKLHELEEGTLRTVYLIDGAFAAIGLVFVILGAIVKKFPVPITILGLVIYIGSVAVWIAIAGVEHIGEGAVFRIITVIALAKAVQSAIAYEHERKAAADVAAGWAK